MRWRFLRDIDNWQWMKEASGPSVFSRQEELRPAQLQFILFFFLILKFYLFTYLFFYWSIVDLQCCTSFRCTAKWFSYTHTHIYILFQIHFPYRLLHKIKYSSLCYTVGPCCLFYVQYCCISVNPKFLIYPSPHLSPLVTISLFSMSVGLFLVFK